MHFILHFYRHPPFNFKHYYYYYYYRHETTRGYINCGLRCVLQLTGTSKATEDQPTHLSFCLIYSFRITYFLKYANPWVSLHCLRRSGRIWRWRWNGGFLQNIFCVTFMPHTWKTTRCCCFWANSVTLITPAYFVAHLKSAYEPIVIICK